MEDSQEQAVLRQQLETTEESLQFLVLIILSILLSFWSVVLQRRQLVDTLAGRQVAETAIRPLKHAAGALIIGSLGFFFALALEAWQSAQQGQDTAAQASALRNLWASLFVLVAALIRMYDLNSGQPQPEAGQDLLS
ncbi:MAG: hypothetical protein HFE97_04945 [Oscillospiraceae bacterium]|nr:hypothetical protein [Oscillospiraceae bacterium]